MKKRKVNKLKISDKKTSRGMIFVLILLSIIAVIYPLSGFFSEKFITSPDLINHLWISGYYGEYIFDNLSIPSVINPAFHSIGDTSPLFYGKSLYVIWGILGKIVGVEESFKILLLIFQLIMFISIYLLIKKITNNSLFLSCFIPTIFCLSIYPLTNIYNRGAITEYFAINIFVISIMFWLISLYENEYIKKIVYKVIFTITMLFFVNIHPISTLFGFFIFILIILFSIYIGIFEIKEKNNIGYEKKKRKNIDLWKIEIISSIISFILIIIFNLEFLYIILRFSGEVAIAKTTGLLMFTHGIDELFTKLSLLPMDRRVQGAPVSEISTPYLDAQINSHLLIISIILFYMGIILWLNRKKEKVTITRCYFIMATICFFLSLLLLFATTIAPWEVFRNKNTLPLLRYAQFAYRFVNQINIFLLLSCILMLIFIYRNKNEKLWISIKKYNKLFYAASITILSLSIYGVYQKINYRTDHSWFGYQALTQSNIDFFLHDLLFLPETFNSRGEYRIEGPELNWEEYSELELMAIQFPPGERFGNVNDIELKLTKKTLIIFRIQPFPWNYILINDKLIKTSEMPTVNDLPSIILESGIYSFKYIFEKDFNIKNISNRNHL